MSLSARHIALSIALVAGSSSAGAQVFTENGMASGSGLAYLPTPAMIPMAHWRVNYARIDYLGAGRRGMNLFGMEYGLSPNLEGYIRLTGEQLGTISSLSSFGFGVKGLIPIRISPVNAAGVWFETATTDNVQTSRFFPAKVSRGGVLLSFGGYAVNPVLLAGTASSGGGMRLLAGAGLSLAPSSGLQIGVEALRGYSAETSLHLGLNVSARVAPHVAILATPGYLRTPDDRTWTISLGIAVSTADLDFRPAAETLKRDDFKLPSLEDIMKDSSGENKQ